MSDQAITNIDQLAAALEAEEPQTEVENAQPETEAQSDDQQEAVEVEGEQAESVEGDEGDQPETASLDDTVVAWETASGDKFEVPVAELKSGYMRDQDYRQKTQNLAQEREQAATQIQQRFQTVQTYAEDFGALYAINAQIAALEQAIPTMDKHSDPIGYFDAVTQVHQLKDHRAGIATRVQQADQQRTEQQQAELADAQQKMMSDLQNGPKAIPGFGVELIKKLDAAGLEYGYAPKDMQVLTDPRFVRILHDAMQFKALQAKAPAAVNKVKAAPIKPTKQASTAVSSGIEQQVKSFARKKDLNSFAALLQHTL